MVSVADAPSPAGVLRKIGIVADALGVPVQGTALQARLQDELAQAGELVARAASSPRVLFLLSIGSGLPLATGADTSADGIIELAGGSNAVVGYEGYKPISPEAMVEAAPDIILVTDRTLGLLGGADKLWAMPALASTPAARERRLVVMDGLLLLGFGPRAGVAVRELAMQLHPGLGQ